MIVDLFAGPGGWSQALRDLGREEVGIELDPDTCATRSANGFATVRADVAQYPPPAWLEGLIASPPCPAFSAAGKKEGRRDIPRLLEHAASCASGWSQPVGPWEHPESPLVLEALRWALASTPSWIACEQVPPVLPFWRECERTLRALGWRTWSGLLNSADYGVPQTRVRAILLASRGGQVAPPTATHYDPRKGAGLFGEPWVTMAEGLGWDGSEVVNDGRLSSWSPEWGAAERPSRVVTGGTRNWAYERPSPTLTTTRRSSEGGLAGRQLGRVLTRGEGRPQDAFDPVDRPAKSVTTKESWVLERPATTVACDPRVAVPGHKRDRDNPLSPGRMEGAIKVTVEEAAALQSFPPGFAWAGSKSSRFRQVGNAVPVGLARAVLAQVVR